MRRLVLAVLCILAALPMAANAQEQQALWEFSRQNYLDVTDIGFRFYYPVGWVWGTGRNGISIAQTQDDLAAQLDDDDTTRAKGQVIGILGIPVAALAELGDDLTLNSMADFVVEMGRIRETERVEVPVTSRRSISLFGENSEGRFGIASMWTQNGYLVLTTVGAPDEATILELAYTWGVTIGSIEPLEAEELGSEFLAGATVPFIMNYPATWTADARQPTAVVFELEDDIGQGLAESAGIGLSVVESPIADLDFPEDATLEDIVLSTHAQFGLDETATREEFVFLGQPADVTIGEVADGSGGTKGLILTLSLTEDGNGVMFVLFAPSLERAREFAPTWTRMMQSARTTG